MMMMIARIQEVEEIDISDDEPMVRRLGEENEDTTSPFQYGRSWGRRITIQHKDQATRRARKSYPHRRCKKR